MKVTNYYREQKILEIKNKYDKNIIQMVLQKRNPFLVSSRLAALGHEQGEKFRVT